MYNDVEKYIEFYKNKNDDLLFEAADRVCRDNYGGDVFLRGLVEFSNFCSRDCLYCGLRRSNGNVNRCRLDADEIRGIVDAGYNSGLRSFVLQSGEDPFYTTERIAAMVCDIKSKYGDEIAVTLSCGVKKREEFAQLKGAGADRYLIRFETSDEKIYNYLKNGEPLSARLNALYYLKSLGFETGSGFMTGLPGETEETRIKNCLLCRELELDMAGIGPFIPHPETPLNGSVLPDLDTAVRTVALLRLMLPFANIPATTAAGSLDGNGRERMLSAGANVLMPNITPVAVKKEYLIYPGKICLDESGFECIGCLSGRVKTVGKSVSFARGDSVSRRVKEL